MVSGGIHEKQRKVIVEEAKKRLPRERNPRVIENIARHDRVILDFLEERGCAGNLLDVGCGRGLLLSSARARGWKVKGLEPARPTAEEGVRERELDIVIGTLADTLLENNSFDAVIMKHSLEHVENPLAALETVGCILKSGGWLYVETPNWNSLSRRLLGARWWNVDLKNHLFYFSPRSLEMVCRRAGLRLRTGRGIHFDLPAVLIRLLHFRERSYNDLEKINEIRDRIFRTRGMWRLFSAGDSLFRAMLGASYLNDYLACWFQK